MCKGMEIHLSQHGLLQPENTELGDETTIQAGEDLQESRMTSMECGQFSVGNGDTLQGFMA